MAEMKLLYIRESEEQPVASGKAVFAAIEFSDREDVRVLIDRIVDNENETGVCFVSYTYFEAFKGNGEKTRVMELILSIEEEATVVGVSVILKGMIE